MKITHSSTRTTLASLSAILCLALAACEQSGQIAETGAERAAETPPVSQQTAPANPIPTDSEPVEPAGTAGLAAAPSIPVVQPAGIGPRISFAKRSHDFGKIWDIEKKSCSFEHFTFG